MIESESEIVRDIYNHNNDSTDGCADDNDDNNFNYDSNYKSNYIAIIIIIS